MSKVTKNERISTLEDAVAMNWSDMKKIETKISRAMTDMATRISNISLQLEGQQRQIHLAADSIGLNKQAIIMLENKAEPKPQLKQLDQSVFDGLSNELRFASVDDDGRVFAFDVKPEIMSCEWDVPCHKICQFIDDGYDASNWQNSLIERDIAKELLEVDLSSELTGSELCKAMLARGDVCVPCFVAWDSDAEAIADKSIWLVHEFLPEAPNFHAGLEDFYCAVPINTRTGEPLTASEVGL